MSEYETRLFETEETQLDITRLLKRASAGERIAFDELYAKVYPDIRKAARLRLLKGGRDLGLQTTSLINEAYLRIAQKEDLTLDDRKHFFAYVSLTMRSVIVDLAREAATDRRGGLNNEVTLNTEVADVASAQREAHELIDIDRALTELSAIDERIAKIVEMRYFAGMTEEEIAETVSITVRTVTRDWQKAKLFLHERLQSYRK
jgi:RNA polymerase sigma factor (TIGR02999 family)